MKVEEGFVPIGVIIGGVLVDVSERRLIGGSGKFGYTKPHKSMQGTLNEIIERAAIDTEKTPLGILPGSWDNSVSLIQFKTMTQEDYNKLISTDKSCNQDN